MACSDAEPTDPVSEPQPTPPAPLETGDPAPPEATTEDSGDTLPPPCEEDAFVGHPIANLSPAHQALFPPGTSEAGLALLPGMCVSLHEDLVAVNWYTVADPEALAQYHAAAGPLIQAAGAVGMAGGSTLDPPHEAPPGTPPEGGVYAAEELSLLWWPSADAMADAFVSDPFLDIVHLKEAGTEPGYVLVLQSCLVCRLGEPRPEDWMLVLHVRVAWADLEQAVPALEAEAEASGAGSLAYAGVSVARPVRRDASGDEHPLLFLSDPWIDGTLLFDVTDPGAAASMVALPALEDLRSRTRDDVIMLARAP